MEALENINTPNKETNLVDREIRACKEYIPSPKL